MSAIKEAITALKELHEAGYSAMTLAAAALIAVAYQHYFETPGITARVSGVESQVKDIRQTQLETRLDQAYSALCASPGDPQILERLRDLQQQYEMVLGHRYPQPSCDLLAKISR